MIDGGTIIGAVTGAIAVSSTVVGLYVRATRAELRQEIGKTRQEIIEHINGKYVGKDHCDLKEAAVHSLIAGIRRELGLPKVDG